MRSFKYQAPLHLLEAAKKRKRLQDDSSKEAFVEETGDSASQDLINDHDDGFDAGEDLDMESDTPEEETDKSLV